MIGQKRIVVKYIYFIKAQILFYIFIHSIKIQKKINYQAFILTIMSIKARRYLFAAIQVTSTPCKYGVFVVFFYNGLFVTQ